MAAGASVAQAPSEALPLRPPGRSGLRHPELRLVGRLRGRRAGGAGGVGRAGMRNCVLSADSAGGGGRCRRRRRRLPRALHDLVQRVARLRRQPLRAEHRFDDGAVRGGEMRLLLQARAQRAFQRLDVRRPARYASSARRKSFMRNPDPGSSRRARRSGPRPPTRCRSTARDSACWISPSQACCGSGFARCRAMSASLTSRYRPSLQIRKRSFSRSSRSSRSSVRSSSPPTARVMMFEFRRASFASARRAVVEQFLRLAVIARDLLDRAIAITVDAAVSGPGREAVAAPREHRDACCRSRPARR